MESAGQRRLAAARLHGDVGVPSRRHPGARRRRGAHRGRGRLGGHAPAKLVDLDSEQQLVSKVLGLEVRLATPAGDTLLQGRFKPAAFTDIWTRNTAAAAGDMAAAAMYQSVLTDLSWGDDTASPFLRQLRDETHGGKLSVKFNVDAYNMNFRSGVFATGRLVEQ